jgi:pimeloyl-ACP methyl ester carboxylesterase
LDLDGALPLPVSVAKRTGAEAVIMKDLSHFPMSENPPKFNGYLLPVLEKIRVP